MTRSKIIVTALALCGVGLVLGYVFLVHPWRALPDEPLADIDARWAQVEAWAAVEAGAQADAARLLSALKIADTDREEIEVRLLQAEEAEQPVPVELTKRLEKALQLLREWAEAGGGFGPEPCPLTALDVNALDLLQLAKLALLAAEEPDDPLLGAVVWLGAQARRSGALLLGSVGFTIADAVTSWHVSRRAAPDELTVEQAPLVGEAFPLLAREAVCLHRLASSQLKAGELGRDGDGPPPGLIDLDREILMVRATFGQWLVDAEPKRDDLEALPSALPVDRDALPKSMVVRVLAFDASPLVTAREAVANHANLLRR